MTVVETVDLTSNNVYYTYNICDCVSQSKADKFFTSVLQDIRGSFQLNTSDIRQRRQKPNIELIVNLDQKRSCK